jgi:putative flippase GtrA
MRVIKFSAVGAIGVVVQVAALTALTHVRVHYLVATVWAVEAAVLHNFCWHQYFTWRDREAASVWSRLARFHLSNALISLVGNVAIMRLLVGVFGMQAVVANLFSVATCAAVNYLASDHWVFEASGRREDEARVLSSPAVAGRASAPACAAQREHR